MRAALLALLLPASSQAYARKYGKKRCPCLNATLDTYGGTDCHYAKYTASDADPMCFAPNYGASCGPWDGAAHSACLAEDDADEPAFCGSSFCYVNATECIESNVSMSRSNMIEGMYWSYATCGEVEPGVSWSSPGRRDARA